MNNTFGQPGYGAWSETIALNKPPHYEETYIADLTSATYSGSIYIQKGWTVKLDPGNPAIMHATLDCEVGSDGVTPITSGGVYNTINHGIQPTIVDKEILDCNVNMISWIGQIPIGDKLMLEQHIANPDISGSTSWTGSLQSTASLVVWNMSLSGQKTIPVVVPTYKYHAVVYQGFNLVPYNTNVLSIYSLATMTTNCNIPTNWYNALNCYTQTDPSTAYTNGIPYHYGWQKKPASQDGNGIQITIDQCYEFGLWPQNVYGTPL